MSKAGIAASIAAATAALAFSTAVSGQAQPNLTRQSYVGGSVGRSDFGLGGGAGITSDTRDTGFKLYGGRMFTPHFGVEASLFDLGEATGAMNAPGLGRVAGTAKARGAALYGVAALPFNNFAAFAKAGAAYTRGELNASSPLGRFSDTESSVQPAYGLGLKYAFSEQFGVRAEWERTRVKFPGNNKEDIDLLSVGLSYHF